MLLGRSILVGVTLLACMLLLLGCESGKMSSKHESTNMPDKKPIGSNGKSSGNVNSDSSELDIELDIFELPRELKPEVKFAYAISVARTALANDEELKPTQRDSSNYSLEVRHNSDFVFVLFVPKDSELSSAEGSGETELGRDVYYIVRKKDQKLVGRRFFK